MEGERGEMVADTGGVGVTKMPLVCFQEGAQPGNLKNEHTVGKFCPGPLRLCSKRHHLIFKKLHVCYNFFLIKLSFQNLLIEYLKNMMTIFITSNFIIFICLEVILWIFLSNIFIGNEIRVLIMCQMKAHRYKQG